MLVLRSTHRALLCEKDARIAALQSEVAFLRECVRPPSKESGRESFITVSEANAVLDGKQDQIILPPPATSERDQAIAEEASALFSGTY